MTCIPLAVLLVRCSMTFKELEVGFPHIKNLIKALVSGDKTKLLNRLSSFYKKKYRESDFRADIGGIQGARRANRFNRHLK